MSYYYSEAEKHYSQVLVSSSLRKGDLVEGKDFN